MGRKGVRWPLILAAVVALAVAAQQTFAWTGDDLDGRAALYRPSTWRDLREAELLMTSRGLAVVTMLVVAGLAAIMGVQRRRPGALPTALPAVVGAAILGCLLVVTGFVRLVPKMDRIVQPAPSDVPVVPTIPIGTTTTSTTAPAP
jgi:hypothetical protein